MESIDFDTVDSIIFVWETISFIVAVAVWVISLGNNDTVDVHGETVFNADGDADDDDNNDGEEINDDDDDDDDLR